CRSPPRTSAPSFSLRKTTGDTSALRAQNDTPAPTATPTYPIISSATIEADAQEATKRHNALQLRVVDPQTRDGFRWIDLSSISEGTVVRYLVMVAAKPEARLACALPDKLGLTTTSLSSDAYFSGLDCTSREFGLLAFCPLDTEEDLSGQSLFDLIADTLMRYSKPWDAVGVMVGATVL
ncbi:hypothetical protein JG687_00016457, partial [Phytophthora cactorum]